MTAVRAGCMALLRPPPPPPLPTGFLADSSIDGIFDVVPPPPFLFAS